MLQGHSWNNQMYVVSTSGEFRGLKQTNNLVYKSCYAFDEKNVYLRKHTLYQLSNEHYANQC